MQLDEHHAWSGHRDGITITLVGPPAASAVETLSWADVTPR